MCFAKTQREAMYGIRNNYQDSLLGGTREIATALADASAEGAR